MNLLSFDQFIFVVNFLIPNFVRRFTERRVTLRERRSKVIMTINNHGIELLKRWKERKNVRSILSPPLSSSSPVSSN